MLTPPLPTQGFVADLVSYVGASTEGMGSRMSLGTGRGRGRTHSGFSRPATGSWNLIKAQNCWNQMVIHPHDRWKAGFDFVMAIAVVYTLVIAPLGIAYRVDIPNGLSWAIDAFYIVDFMLQFFHGYMDRGYPVLEIRKIARKYLKSYMAVDFISSIPWDLVTGIACIA